MFSIKSETSDTFDVDKDSHRIRCIETNRNLHISDTLSTNTSANLPDKDLSEEMLFTVAYVKNESTSNALDYHTSNSIGNTCMNDQHLADIDAIKTGKVEGCSSYKSGNVTEEEHTIIKVKDESQNYRIEEHDIHYVRDISQPDRVGDEEHDTMQVRDESQYDHIKEHNIHLVTDVSQHDRVGGCDTINMGEQCPSSATQSRYNRHKHIPKRVHSAGKRYKCDLCSYSARRSSDLLRHKRVHTGDKPYKCDVCDYSTTQYGNMKTHKRVHSGEKPYKCQLCDFSTAQSGHLKTHKLIHTGEKPYKW